VYYRLQFGPYGRSYWVAFQFLTIFLPRRTRSCFIFSRIFYLISWAVLVVTLFD
ncbi:hypothetical protein KSS87_022371, partial [Heliosperma pusillum]